MIWLGDKRGERSLTLQSIGERFGDPGFYFVAHEPEGFASAKYIPSLKEEIRVYPAEPDCVRTDHTLWFLEVDFLRLHYRMRKQHQSQPAPHPRAFTRLG